jgi:hypothetical protein
MTQGFRSHTILAIDFLGITIASAALLLSTRILLNRRGYAAAHDFARKSSTKTRKTALVPGDLARIVRRVAQINDKRLNCLPKSLTLWTLLQQVGYPATIKIGATPRHGIGSNPLQAHAWVELYGEPLGEIGSVEAFVVLPHDSETPHSLAGAK